MTHGGPDFSEDSLWHIDRTALTLSYSALLQSSVKMTEEAEVVAVANVAMSLVTRSRSPPLARLSPVLTKSRAPMAATTGAQSSLSDLHLEADQRSHT